MEEQGSSLHMPKKLQPQTRPPVGSLDDPGDVGNDEGEVVPPGNDAQIWNQGGERIIGDFGPYRGDLGNQSGFARVGISDDPHVGHEFQFQQHPTGFPGLAGFGAAGGLMDGSGESGIPPASLSAPGYDEGLVFPGQVPKLFSTLRVPDDRAAGNGKKKGRSTSPLLIFSFSVLTSSGVVLLAVTKIEESGELAVGLQKHVPAFSPVAAVGTSAGNVLFAAKADAAVSSIAGLDEDFGFIDELDLSDSRSLGDPCGAQLTSGIKPEPPRPGKDRR